jgi:hypothetical protein
MPSAWLTSSAKLFGERGLAAAVVGLVAAKGFVGFVASVGSFSSGVRELPTDAA